MVSEATLRSRINGKVALDVTKSGLPPVLGLEEETHLMNHLEKMGSCGYGYSRKEVLDVAILYASS